MLTKGKWKKEQPIRKYKSFMHVQFVLIKNTVTKLIKYLLNSTSKIRLDGCCKTSTRMSNKFLKNYRSLLGAMIEIHSIPSRPGLLVFPVALLINLIMFHLLDIYHHHRKQHYQYSLINLCHYLICMTCAMNYINIFLLFMIPLLCTFLAFDPDKKVFTLKCRH